MRTGDFLNPASLFWDKDSLIERIEIGLENNSKGPRKKSIPEIYLDNPFQVYIKLMVDFHIVGDSNHMASG